MSMSDAAQPPPPAAVRFVFAYDEDGVRVLSQRRVGALTPPTDALESVEEIQGLQAELRTAEGALLYRKVMPPIPSDVEVFAEDPQQSVERVPVERPSGIFTVLVPELPEADSLTLVSHPAEPARPSLAGREILRVPLRRDDEEGGT